MKTNDNKWHDILTGNKPESEYETQEDKLLSSLGNSIRKDAEHHMLREAISDQEIDDFLLTLKSEGLLDPGYLKHQTGHSLTRFISIAAVLLIALLLTLFLSQNRNPVKEEKSFVNKTTSDNSIQAKTLPDETKRVLSANEKHPDVNKITAKRLVSSVIITNKPTAEGQAFFNKLTKFRKDKSIANLVGIQLDKKTYMITFKTITDNPELSDFITNHKIKYQHNSSYKLFFKDIGK